MTVEEQIKAKVHQLRTIQAFIDELKKLREIGQPSHDELLDVEKFVNGQIENYKQLVRDINNRNKSY